MGLSRGRFVVSAIGATTLLGGCTLINLSGLQGGVGGSSSSNATSTDVTTTPSSASSSTGMGTGGSGGSGAVIHELYVVGGRAVSGKPLDTIFTTTIADDGTVDPFDPVVQTMPDAREEAGLAFVDSHMFLIGGLGLSGTSVTNRATTFVSALGTDGMLGPWVMTPAMLQSGGYANFGTASDGDHVFIAGGSNSTSSFTSASVLRADVVTDSIQSFGPEGTLPSPSENLDLIVADGVLLALGGSASSKQVLAATLNADGTIGGLAIGPSFNTGRNTSCAAVASIGGSTRVYVVGGVGPPSLASIEVSTMTGGVLGAWQTSPVTLDAGRIGSACVVVGNSLYVIGGVLDSNLSTDEIARVELDAQSGQPTMVTLERPLPAPRGHENALVVDLPAP